jgi:uncharacterized BrkB/YihY/UPF0761 family membrane protein
MSWARSGLGLVVRALRGFLDHDMSTYAAALADRGLLALFPFVIFLIALISVLHVDPTVTAGFVRSTSPARSAAMTVRGKASTSTLRPTASAVAGSTVAMISCIRHTSVHNCSSPKVS